MNLGELVELTNVLVDGASDHNGVYDLSELLPLFNACSGDIVDEARLTKRATALYAANPDGFVSFPRDFYKGVRITFRPEGSEESFQLRPASLDRDDPYTYRKWGNQFAINPTDTDGRLELFYIAYLPKFEEDEEQEPAIPPPFHDIYALYAAFRLVQGERDELNAKRDFQADYFDRKRALDKYTFETGNREQVYITDTLQGWWN